MVVEALVLGQDELDQLADRNRLCLIGKLVAAPDDAVDRLADRVVEERLASQLGFFSDVLGSRQAECLPSL